MHEKVWGCAPEVLMRCKMAKSRMLQSHSFEHFVIFFFFYSLLRYRVQYAISFLSVHRGPLQVCESYSKWWQQLRWAGRLTFRCWNLRPKKRGGSCWEHRRRKVCFSGVGWVAKEREFSQEEKDFNSASSEDECVTGVASALSPELTGKGCLVEDLDDHWTAFGRRCSHCLTLMSERFLFFFKQ